MVQPTNKRLVTEASVGGHVAASITADGPAKTALSATILEQTEPKLDKAEAATTYSPLAVGATFGMFGDSLANFGEGFLYYLAALSKQRFMVPHYDYVVSYGGYTSGGLIPLTGGITGLPVKPSHVFLTCGSNDASSGIAPAQFLANVDTMCKAFRAAGVEPILMTVPPRTGCYARIGEYNVRLSRYARTNGYNIVDSYSVLADPATGLPLAALTVDNIHPNAAGWKAVAVKALADIGDQFRKTLEPTVLSVTAANIFPNGGLKVDSNADGLAESLATTLTAGYTVSLVPDPAGFNWQRMTLSGAAANRQILGATMKMSVSQQSTALTAAAAAGATTISVAANVGLGTYRLTNSTGEYEYVRVLSYTGTGPYVATIWASTPLRFAHGIGDTLTPAFSEGDRVAVAVKARTGQDGGAHEFSATAYNSVGTVLRNIILSSPNGGLSRKLDDASLYMEFIVPAGTDNIQYSIKASADGTYDFALPLLYNLTKAS